MQHVLNKDIDEMEKMDNQWYKVTRSIMQEACGRLRRDVLSKMAPTQDLNKFSVQLSRCVSFFFLPVPSLFFVFFQCMTLRSTRLGGVEWSHVEEDEALATFEAKSSWSAEELRKNLEAHKNNFVQKPGKFMARIKLDYELKHAA